MLEIVEKKTCRKCSSEYRVFATDDVFYQKIGVPRPSLCPDCRQQRRLGHRNERNLYRRKCDLTDKDIISMYSPENPHKVYDQNAWWEGNWDPMEFGREIDFSRPVFEQFHELSLEVPRPCILNVSSDNSQYTNHSGYNKNCYMCINTGFSQDLIHCSNYSVHNRSCVDCSAIQQCERCYFCLNTTNTSRSAFLFECQNCSDCRFCYDCQSCQHCFGCWNLQSASYRIFNTPYSREDYFAKLEELRPKTWTSVRKTFRTFRNTILEKAVHPAERNLHCEYCTGDQLKYSHNTHHSFYTLRSDNCAYCYDAAKMTDCWDVTEPHEGELQYETHACHFVHSAIACCKCYHSSDLYYCLFCHHCSDIFGCIGLKHKEYCILNKQYSKEDYAKHQLRLFEHMRETGEWGEFFPLGSSPFAYNETAAQAYFPLTKEQAVDLGASWREEDEKSYDEQTYEIPGYIRAVPDSITNEILACEHCKKNYKISQSELRFYRLEHYPIPHACPDCRYQVRIELRNPKTLFERKCAQCKKGINTSFPPESRAEVLCHSCYLRSVAAWTNLPA